MKTVSAYEIMKGSLTSKWESLCDEQKNIWMKVVALPIGWGMAAEEQQIHNVDSHAGGKWWWERLDFSDRFDQLMKFDAMNDPIHAEEIQNDFEVEFAVFRGSLWDSYYDKQIRVALRSE